MDKKAYHEKRKRFYRKINHFWADLYGEEYALYDIAYIDRTELERIRTVSDRIGKIFFKVCSLLREVPDRTLIEMGFPKETLSFIRLKSVASDSVIARLDLIPYGAGYKCIEINADTPTFIKELFRVNSEVCKEFGAEDPNEEMEFLLSKEVYGSIEQYARKLNLKTPNVVFTAHEDNLEDRETVRYIQELSGVASNFIPLHKLQIQRGIGLFDEKGSRIDILYRQTFPIENLISDKDADGNRIGLWLLELVEAEKLAIINPPSAFLLQNKAVQAVIWGLHMEEHPFFTKEEHIWIEESFLPTYLEPDYFIMSGLPYVKKPVFGREGDTVEIYNQEGFLTHADVQQSYAEYLPVYQQYAEHPAAHFNSEKGIQKGRLLLGSFLLNGKPSAAGYRIGGAITNNLSYYLPFGIKKGG
ncbi:glutathionylspermidine synthase family protein [Cytobacillus sp. BC1816]|uniref:glutathionylspermidine synthase family protein n=1 Tax=Cytobacillus sp. BC1816 TaxID=3440154 RepID=UPI003F50E655